MFIYSLLLLTGSAVAGDGHEKDNFLYQEIRTRGLALGGDRVAPLPLPRMADGLDAAAQRTVLIDVCEQEDQLAEFTRDSVVAPFVWKIREIEGSDPKAPAFAVDFCFVAYGSLDTVTRQDFRKKVLQADQKERKLVLLSAADLARRKLEDRSEAETPEQFSHAISTLLDKVQLSATSLTVMSRTADSVVLANRLDPRFNSDAEFPNQWRSMERDDQGAFKLGPVQPYGGSGSYLKITRLAEPAGALFVESHSVYVEPHGWFNGKSLLRSKLPTMMQNEVRSFRRELKKLAP
jgi:hypothetical protein